MKTQPPEASLQARVSCRQKQPRSPVLCKALLPAAALVAGCTRVPVHPDLDHCPKQALAAMAQELHWINQYSLYRARFELVPDERWSANTQLWFHPGDTVVGIVPKDIPPDQMPLAPSGTRFLGGKVYVSTEINEGGYPGNDEDLPGYAQVTYDRVKLPGQDELPICFVVGIYAEEVKDGAARAVNRAGGRPYARALF